MAIICFNGAFLPADQPVLMASNKSYRYGDGLFETMQVSRNRILLEDLHFDRLFAGMRQLGYQQSPGMTPGYIRGQIVLLCEKNNCTDLARIRLSVFRGNGDLNQPDDETSFLIECWPLDPSAHLFNENGYIIDIYPAAKKSCDAFSHLKTASHLQYVMAAAYARNHGLNDCVLLNAYGRIADSTIANIFIVKSGQIFTPSLNEGCIAGVMRRYLFSKVPIVEKALAIEDIMGADEVFLTNAIQGIRWVKQFQGSAYQNPKAKSLHEMLRAELWQY
jgi:branched-chain amino acid aminotransferase